MEYNFFLFKFKSTILAWILVSFMPIICLSAGFGEGCDDSNPCLAGLVCSTTTSKCECEEPGFNYIQGKCIDTPYGGPCSGDEDCSRGGKCLYRRQDEPPLCIAAPRGVHEVNVEQYLDDSMNIIFNITWKLREYTGPTWYVIDVRGKDYTMATYQYGSITITEIDKTFLISKGHQYGGWLYRILITPVTAAGEGPVYETEEFNTIESKPGLVRDVEVHQDSDFANQMKLSFKCPRSIERNGNITAFIIRKTDTTDDSDVSTEHTIPYHFKADECEIEVNASQVGGMKVLHNYTFEVKVKNSKYEGNFSAPVDIFISARKPYASTTAFLEKLISPHEKKLDNEVPSSFDVKLCSSCYLDPVQGPIRSAALIICVESEVQRCDSSFIHLYDESMTKSANGPEDINLYQTWASANANNFSIPYRATPDGWIETLRRDNSESYIYTVGSNKNCDEKDKETYCNGPVPHGRQFQVGVLVCNDAGCDATLSYDERFNTKAEVNDDDDGDDTTILGLSIGLGIVSLICICLVIYICLKKSQRGSMQVNV